MTTYNVVVEGRIVATYYAEAADGEAIKQKLLTLGRLLDQSVEVRETQQ